MVDSNSLADRIDALQQQLAQQEASRRRLSIIGVIFSLVIVVLLGITLRRGNSPGGKDVKEMFWLLAHNGGTQEERLEAFLALVEEGNTEWRIAQLKGLDLSGLELSGADLADATLDNCKFVDTNLTQANLYRVGLEAACCQVAMVRSRDMAGGGKILDHVDKGFCLVRRLERVDQLLLAGISSKGRIDGGQDTPVHRYQVGCENHFHT